MTRPRFIGTARQTRKIKPSSIPTWKLKEIVDGDGISSHGTDYGPILGELRIELSKRAHQENVRNMRRAHYERLRSEQAAPSHVTCTACQVSVTIGEAAALFYRDPRKKNQPNVYRTKCKDCMRAEALAGHDNQTQTPF